MPSLYDLLLAEASVIYVGNFESGATISRLRLTIWSHSRGVIIVCRFCLENRLLVENCIGRFFSGRTCIPMVGYSCESRFSLKNVQS
jgi:hypothetical protein